MIKIDKSIQRKIVSIIASARIILLSTVQVEIFIDKISYNAFNSNYVKFLVNTWIPEFFLMTKRLINLESCPAVELYLGKY